MAEHKIFTYNTARTAGGPGAEYHNNSYWVCTCGEKGQPIETNVPVLIRKDFRKNHLERLHED